MDAYIESVLIARLSDREYREAIFKPGSTEVSEGLRRA
jgi:hypothetical protein